jgi:hypothetical protein
MMMARSIKQRTRCRTIRDTTNSVPSLAYDKERIVVWGSRLRLPRVDCARFGCLGYSGLVIAVAVDVAIDLIFNRALENSLGLASLFARLRGVTNTRAKRRFCPK